MNSTDALLDVCRVCLVRRGTMRVIKNTKLHVIYEMLTQAKLIRSDGAPETVCYLCHSQLKKCCKFMEFAQESEKILKLCLLGVQKDTIVAPNRCPLNLKKIEPILLSMPNITKHTIKTEVSKPINVETLKYSIEKQKINDNVINKHNIEMKDHTEIKQSAMEIEEYTVNKLINDKNPEEKDKSIFNRSAMSLDINAVKKQTAIEITNNTEKDVFEINKDKCVIKTELKDIEKVCDRAKAKMNVNKDQNDIEKDQIDIDKVKNDIETSQSDIEKDQSDIEKDQSDTEKGNNDIEENNAEQIAFIKAQIAILKQRILMEKEEMSKDKDKIIKEEIIIKEELIAEGEEIENENNLLVTDDVMDLDDEIECQPVINTESSVPKEGVVKIPASTLLMDLQKVLRQNSGLLPETIEIEPDAQVRVGIDLNKYQNQEKTTEKLESNPQPIPITAAFACSICSLPCESAASRDLHMREHSEPTPFVCRCCRRGFVKLPHADSHMRIHTNIKQRQCYICDGQFPDMVQLQLHMRKHISERHLCCKTCRKRYKSVDSLREHFKTHKERKNLFT